MPAARHAFKGCDALLAVGTRFSEIPTGSFGAQVLLKDAALSQIAQAQQRPYQRLTCIELGQSIDLAGVAQATGAACVLLPDDASAADAIAQARALAAEGRPVIVDVAIDYSKPTAFTLGPRRPPSAASRSGRSCASSSAWWGGGSSPEVCGAGWRAGPARSGCTRRRSDRSALLGFGCPRDVKRESRA